MKFIIHDAETFLPLVRVETAKMEELKSTEVVFFDGHKWVTDDPETLLGDLVREAINEKKGLEEGQPVFNLGICPSAFWGTDIEIAGRKVTYRPFSPQSKGDKSSWGYYIHPLKYQTKVLDLHGKEGYFDNELNIVEVSDPTMAIPEEKLGELKEI